VIQSFADPATEALLHGHRSGRVGRFPAEIRGRAIRKLDVLNAAHRLMDLRSPPGNRLEALRGVPDGHHSIRVNEQWRIVFQWTDAGPVDVTLIDDH